MKKTIFLKGFCLGNYISSPKPWYNLNLFLIFWRFVASCPYFTFFVHSKKSEQQSIECVFLTCSVEIFVFSSLFIANSLLINRAETLAP